MQEKCCCGCSLSTATSFVLALSSIEAACVLFCNIELLVLITEQDYFNPFSFLIDANAIEDFDVVHGILLAAIGLNAFWIVSAVLAARGNITLRHGRLTTWVMLTYLITLFNLAATIYFGVLFQGAIAKSTDFYVNGKPSKMLTYLTFLTLYSGGGGILLFLNIYFAHVVQLRGKEIDQDYSTLASYILSQLNRCPHSSPREAHTALLPEAPPSYTPTGPTYLPVAPRTRGSSVSSWSLSYEALRTMNQGEAGASCDPKTEQKKVQSSTDLAGMVRLDAPLYYYPVNVNINNSSVLPY